MSSLFWCPFEPSIPHSSSLFQPCARPGQRVITSVWLDAHPLAEAVFYRVAHLSEGPPLLPFCSLHTCRVGKAPVDAGGAAREDRAAFSRVVTHRDHVVNRLAQELAKVLGSVGTY